MVNLLIPKYMRLTQQEKDLIIRLLFKDCNRIPKKLQTRNIEYQKPHIETKRTEKIKSNVGKQAQHIITHIEK